MLPLNYAQAGEEQEIKKLGGSQEVRQHLQDMGFNVGERVMIISALGGNIIVKVKDTRVAVSSELASRIMI